MEKLLWAHVPGVHWFWSVKVPTRQSGIQGPLWKLSFSSIMFQKTTHHEISALTKQVHSQSPKILFFSSLFLDEFPTKVTVTWSFTYRIFNGSDLWNTCKKVMGEGLGKGRMWTVTLLQQSPPSNPWGTSELADPERCHIDWSLYLHVNQSLGAWGCPWKGP